MLSTPDTLHALVEPPAKLQSAQASWPHDTSLKGLSGTSLKGPQDNPICLFRVVRCVYRYMSVCIYIYMYICIRLHRGLYRAILQGNEKTCTQPSRLWLKRLPKVRVEMASVAVISTCSSKKLNKGGSRGKGAGILQGLRIGNPHYWCSLWDMNHCLNS